MVKKLDAAKDVEHRVLVEEHICRAFRVLVADQIAERPAAVGLLGLRRGLIDVDRLLDDRELLAGEPEAAGNLFRRRRAAERVEEPGRRPAPLREQLHHVGGNADRLAGVDQGPLDRLLDPVAGVGAEARADARVEALDGPKEPEVSLLDEVGERQATIGVAAGDVDDEAEIGADHVIAGLGIPLADRHRQFLLLVCRQKRRVVDLTEIGFERVLNGSRGGLAAGGGHGVSTVLVDG